MPISDEKSRLLQIRKEVKKTSKTAQKKIVMKKNTWQMVAQRLATEVAVAKRLTKSYSRTSPHQRQKTSRTPSFHSTASPFARAHTTSYSSKRGNHSIFAKFLKTKNPSVWPKDQLYVVFSTRNGGIDLENFNLHDCKEAFSVLLQITVALAVAEEACGFEHRDLHWGNVLCVPIKLM